MDVEFDRRQMIGWGPNGTVVLRGTLKGGQPVAVKRFISKQLKWIAKEFDIYRIQEHENILKLYNVTKDETGFTYFALELCVCNLANYLKGKYKGPALSARSILLQTTRGLQHLHSSGVVHRSLKPTNILISWPSSSGEIKIKLSDFGCIARWDDSWPCGDPDSVQGWLAPEQIKSGSMATALTTSADVFALGCLFFSVLTSGQHPFGSPSYFRDQRALEGHYELAPLVHQMPVAAMLIETMIQRAPDSRPSTQDILAQTDFWSIDI